MDGVDGCYAGEDGLVRVGLDLHDGPLQDLAFAIGCARELCDDLADGRPRTAAAAASDLLAVLVELEGTLRTLAATLEGRRRTHASVSLYEELEGVARRFARRTGISAEIDCDEDCGELPASWRQALVQVVSEALENARRHSGAARLSIEARQEADGITLEVRDDGVGFDVEVETERLGLRGMAERVRQCGGELEVESAGGGTCVRALLPAPRRVGPARRTPPPT